MANLKQIFVVTMGALLASMFLFLGTQIFLIRPDVLEQKIIQAVKNVPGADLNLQGFHLTYFPQLVVKVDRFDFQSKSAFEIELHGEHLRLALSSFSLLFGEIQVNRLDFDTGTYGRSDQKESQKISQPWLLKDIRFRLGKIRLKRPVHFDLNATYADVPNAIRINGFFTLPGWNQLSWRHLGFEGKVYFRDWVLVFLNQLFGWEKSFQITEGRLGGELQVKKANESAFAAVKGKLACNSLVYQLASREEAVKSSPIQVDSEVDLSWNQEKGEMTMNRWVVRTPAGNFESLGRFLYHTGEFKDVRITVSELMAEKIPLYLPQLNQILPFNIGFSGPSSLETSLSGTWDHLSVDANWDLSGMLIAYGRYFLKPKDYGMNAFFNFLIEDMSKISGDFTLRLQNTSFKGTLKNYFVKESSGQLSVLSNKFQLSGWEALIPPLAQFKLGGQMKILANQGGPLREGKNQQTVVNVTLDDASLVAPKGLGFHDVNVEMDYTPLALEIKKLNLALGEGQKIESDLTVYNFSEGLDYLNFRGHLQADRLEPESLVQLLAMVEKEWLPKNTVSWSSETQAWIQKYLPNKEPLSKLEASFQWDKKRLTLEPLHFEAYEGTHQIKNVFDFSTPLVGRQFHLESNRVNLARYFSGKSGEGVMTGNLFLKGDFTSQGLILKEFEKNMKGSGEFSVTQGQFNSFDILGSIGAIDIFGELGLLATKKTSFDDLRAAFSYEEGKWTTRKMILLSPELSLESQGEVGHDGDLNLRVDAYLSSALTEHYLTPMLGSQVSFENKQFGPIPLLISGSIEHPEIKPNANQLEDLKANLQRRKTQQILRNFLPEETIIKKT